MNDGLLRMIPEIEEKQRTIGLTNFDDPAFRVHRVVLPAHRGKEKLAGEYCQVRRGLKKGELEWDQYGEKAASWIEAALFRSIVYSCMVRLPSSFTRTSAGTVLFRSR
jgi:hypothetical protein